MNIELLNLAAETLNFANVIVFGLISTHSFSRFLKTRRPRYIALGLIGFYWCALYVYVILSSVGAVPTFFDSIWFGRIFVRPAFTLTGSFMLWSLAHSEAEAALKAFFDALSKTNDDQAPK